MYVEVSSRDAENDVDTSFLDGCAVLWVVLWPSSGTVQDYLDRFRSYIHRRLKKTDVYISFYAELKARCSMSIFLFSTDDVAGMMQSRRLHIACIII